MTIAAYHTYVSYWRWFHANRQACLVAARLLYAEPLKVSEREQGQWFDDVSRCDVCGAYINWSDRVDTDDRHR